MSKIYIMANLNKELKGLFNKYLDRLSYEKTHPKVEHQSYQPNLFDEKYTGVIYFYEWSDVTRTPKSFYSIEKFEEFLKSCEIYMQGFQREIISHMHNPYISCKKGEKELIIKSTYDSLKTALLDDSVAKGNPFRSTGAPSFNPMAKGSEERIPYNVGITRPPIQRPHMVFEPESRYPEMMPHAHNGEFWDW